MSSQQTHTAQAVSTRFTPDTLARLDEIAQNRQCSRSEIIKEAVDGYLNSLTWYERAVRQGLDDIAAGRVVNEEEVKESVRRLGLNVG